MWLSDSRSPLSKRALVQSTPFDPRIIEVPSHPSVIPRKWLGQGAHQRARKRAQRMAVVAGTSAKSNAYHEPPGPPSSRAIGILRTPERSQTHRENLSFSLLPLSPLAPSVRPSRTVSIPELIFTPLKELPTPSELFSPYEDALYIPVDSSPEKILETPTTESPSHAKRELAF